MIGIEKEVSDITEKVELARRALYNNLKACADYNDTLAEVHFSEFRQLLKQISTAAEDAIRKRNQLKSGTTA